MYAKLFSSILDSSVWLEAEHTRIVWLTLLAAKDEDGFARFATVENLAGRARIPLDKATEAVGILEAPDPNSSNPTHGGRRIERVPGGWMVLNATIYDAIGKRADEREQTRERVRRHRTKAKEPDPPEVAAKIEDTRKTEMQQLGNAYELTLIPQFGAMWESVGTFLDTKSTANRPAWAKEIGTLTIAHGPEIVARACNDALAAPDPVRMTSGLRAMCAGIREAGIRDTAAAGGETDEGKLRAWAAAEDAKRENRR